MVTYDLMLERQRLFGADKFSIAANSNETVCLRFHFDRHWRRFDSKAAVFRNGKNEYYIIEINQNRVSVPWEVLTQTGEIELSVIGYEAEKVLSSDKAVITVSESLLPEDYKTFSPSEVLFDRFRKECIAQAYLDYEDEITELKKAHSEEKLLLGEKIEEANARTQTVLNEKNSEIENLELLHQTEVSALRQRIADMDLTLMELGIKAEKWDLIDIALGLKTMASYSLLAGGKDVFDLPMLNTSSVTAFSASNFGPNIRSVGLDLSSAVTFSSVFANHTAIESLELINTGNISSFAGMLESCKSIRTVTIGSMNSCNSIARFANEATLLSTVSFGSDVQAGSYERAFCNCRVLKTINGCLNLAFASSVSMMFTNCVSLENVSFVENTISRSFSLSDCINLSKESMISAFKGLNTDTPGDISVSAYAFEKAFTQEEREEWIDYVTTAKGWSFTEV